MSSAVSSKMLNAIAPSLSIVSSEASTSESAPSLNYDDTVGLSSTNLSSTLQKLLLWEKKLYEEVKVYAATVLVVKIRLLYLRLQFILSFIAVSFL